MNSYNKSPLSISEQAQYLIDKGLVCDDKIRLERYLSTIGYYRLSVYWFPYLSEDKLFLPNTTFNKILDLYIFDRQLRLLVMEALERIEIALRAKWSCALALEGGSHAYIYETLFEDVTVTKKEQGKKVVDEKGNDVKIIVLKYSKAYEELENKFKELHFFDNKKQNPEDFIQHYKSNYDTPEYPPIWMATEVMSFGMLSRWFQLTKDKIEKEVENKKTNVAIKTSIIKEFGMPNRIDVFERTLHHLTIVRNICAHHSRLWNRRFIFPLPDIYKINGKNASDRFKYETYIGKKDNKTYQRLDNRLYNSLVIIEALLYSISPKTRWKNRLMDLLNRIEPIYHQKMGFPDNWREREPWKSNTP